MKWLRTERIVHDVERSGNLDLLLRGLNGAVNKLADAIGGGLRAIALALSTPQDNSAQVQAEIDKTATQIRAQADALKTAVNNQTKGE